MPKQPIDAIAGAGHNVNSERLASSNRLTEMSIQHFRTRVMELKATIEDLFQLYTPSPRFGECVALHTVNIVKEFVKPERLAEMYACALDMRKEDFDVTLLEQVQQSSISTSERKQRRIPTEEEKDENRKAKSGAVD